MHLNFHSFQYVCSTSYCCKILACVRACMSAYVGGWVGGEGVGVLIKPNSLNKFQISTNFP